MSHIMVIDDERDVVTLLKYLLEKEGHRVSEALHGAQALEKLGLDPSDPGAQMPDLIVLDIMMPVVDGYTLSTRLMNDERTRSIPLVILTARGQMRELFETMPNVVGYVEKPFDPKRLRELILDLISKKG